MDFLNLSTLFDGEALELKRTDEVYPVTLAIEWPRLTRLLILSCLAVIGSVGNIFMISSVMVEDHLKKAGNLCLIIDYLIYHKIKSTATSTTLNS